MNQLNMTKLISVIERVQDAKMPLPFSVYSSIKEQKLLNVPIAKPLLIVVLNGEKQLGKTNDLVCQTGSFIFLSNSPSVDMRNIPNDNEYFALLIEFDWQDYVGLQTSNVRKNDHVIGQTTQVLSACLQQFIESSLWAPLEVLSSRKRELLTLLSHIGYQDVLSLLGNAQIKDKLHDIFIEAGFKQLSMANICSQLALSESTLRRKLKVEGTSIQTVKDNARLGLALHLLQTSQLSIGAIADTCGYQSQSRFTSWFKKRFGLTPSELRKTKLTD